MRNEATLWLAKYMEDHGISTEKISRELHIPKKKLIPGTKESLDADEFLALTPKLYRSDREKNDYIYMPQ